MSGDPLLPPGMQVTTTTGAKAEIKGSLLGVGVEGGVNREVTAPI